MSDHMDRLVRDWSPAAQTDEYRRTINPNADDELPDANGYEDPPINCGTLRRVPGSGKPHPEDAPEGCLCRLCKPPAPEASRGLTKDEAEAYKEVLDAMCISGPPIQLPAEAPIGPQGPCDCEQNACHECRARINPAPEASGYEGECQKCHAVFAFDGPGTPKGLESGTLCPECREGGDGSGLIGVIHWRKSEASGEAGPGTLYGRIVAYLKTTREIDADACRLLADALPTLRGAYETAAALRARLREAEERSTTLASDRNSWRRTCETLTRERDEAREQRDHLSLEYKGLTDQRDILTRHLAAANAAREKAERERDEAATELERIRGLAIADAHGREVASEERDSVMSENASLRAEVARLKGVLAECNAVCLCGCPAEAHESYGEDGEACSKGHECVRVARSVATRIASLRAAITRLVEAGDDLIQPYGNDGRAWESARAAALAARGEK